MQVIHKSPVHAGKPYPFQQSAISLPLSKVPHSRRGQGRNRPALRLASALIPPVKAGHNGSLSIDAGGTL